MLARIVFAILITGALSACGTTSVGLNYSADAAVVKASPTAPPLTLGTFSASKVDGSVLSLNTGVLASVDDLRVVLEKTLRDAVDKALDDNALRAALQL